MGYLLILGAVFLNIVKGYSSKKLSSKTEFVSDNLDLSIMRNFFCVLVGAGFILIGGGADFTITPRGALICLIAGAVMSVNYVAWVMALKTDAIIFASVANNANFIVAAVGGMLFFKENLTLSKGIAMVLILIAMFFMVKYQKSLHGAPTLYDFFLLFLVFLMGGITSLTEKWFTKAEPTLSSHIYTFYAFLFSILVLVIARIFIRAPHTAQKSLQVEKLKSYLPYAVVMGISIYGVTYFKTYANNFLDTIVLYPLNNGLTMIGSCLMAWACFKEKPNKNSIIGMVIIFIALLLSSGVAEKIINLIFT